MKERRVRFTATAGQHVAQERSWWLTNRDHQELFAIELESAVRILAILPGAGTPYLQTTLPTLRRLYVRMGRSQAGPIEHLPNSDKLCLSFAERPRIWYDLAEAPSARLT